MKKIISLLISTCLIFGIVSQNVGFAGSWGASTAWVRTEGELAAALTRGCDIVLGADITIWNDLRVSKSTTVNLNGYRLSFAYGKKFIIGTYSTEMRPHSRLKNCGTRYESRRFDDRCDYETVFEEERVPGPHVVLVVENGCISTPAKDNWYADKSPLCYHINSGSFYKNNVQMINPTIEGDKICWPLLILTSTLGLAAAGLSCCCHEGYRGY